MLEIEYFDVLEDRSGERKGRGEVSEWAKDATNSKGVCFLSHQKMEFEKNMRHPRKNIEGKYEPFTACDNTGHLGFWTESSATFAEEMGPGISIYFKMNKFLGCMFFLFTLMSIPTYIICAQNQSNFTEIKEDPFVLFGVGHLGIEQTVCAHMDLPTKDSTYTNNVFC